MKKKINILALAVMAFAGVSCSFLDVEAPVLTKEKFYKSEAEMLYSLAGVYGVINNEGFYGNYYSLMLSNTDDLSYYNRSSGSNYAVWYLHNAGSPEVYGAWTAIYKGINNANVFMEAAEGSEFDPDGKFYNEARFLRAFYHFILAQAWGDVPLRTVAITDQNKDEMNCKASPQYDVLKWAASEMEACIYHDRGLEVPDDGTAGQNLDLSGVDLTQAPSRVTATTMAGILARLYLFMAGETVSGNEDFRKEYYGKAMNYAGAVISSGLHRLNQGNDEHDGYSLVFINMIEDVYDTRYRESMWEADFLGNRSSSDSWSNGRIGDLIGLQSSPKVGTYDDVNCNFAYGQYNGSVKLWNLYWATDRTDEENEIALADGETCTTDIAAGVFWEQSRKGWDRRQFWNMCPYNYTGWTYSVDGVVQAEYVAGIDRTPYRVSNSRTTITDPTAAIGIRNCGKYRREVIYEGVKGDKGTYTPINYPILRYSDVLLMYAEAQNEYEGYPTEVSYEYVKQVRDRAGIATRDFGEYGYESFRQLVRNERGRELCFESLRKYDLIRWGIFYDSMKEYIEDSQDTNFGTGTVPKAISASTASNVQQRHIVLPVPTIELGVNKDLVQNPLW